MAATNSAGESTFTTPLYFTTPGGVTIPPTPTSPSPGSTSSPGPTTANSTVTLSWGASSGATYYDLGVRDVASGTLVVNTLTTGTSYAATLTAGKIYKWNVAATNSAGESAFTTPLYFTTPGTAPAPSIGSVVPNPITADPNNNAQTLTINGANFVSKPTVYVTWTAPSPGSKTLSASQVTFINSSQLTMSIQLGKIADSWTVKVTNPDGQPSNVAGFTVNAVATPTISSSLSTLTVTPSSAAANGTSIITATATLRDSNNNPVAGKAIQLHSANYVVISQPASPTDANGQAIATITANTPVSTTIWAVDTTDSVTIQQQPNISFTAAATVPINAALNAAINSFNSSSIDTLNGISGLAVDEGAIGDNFQAQVNNAMWGGLFDALTSWLGQIIPDPNGLPAKIAVSLGKDIGGQKLDDVLTTIASNPKGLSNGGIVVSNTCVGDNLALQEQLSALQNGVPQSSINNTAAYVNDLPLRLAANNALFSILQQQDSYLKVLNSASQSSQNNFTTEALGVAGYVGYGLDVAAVIPVTAPVAAPAAAVYNAGLLAANEYDHLQVSDANKAAYFKTYSLLSACWDCAAQINTNVSLAYSEIAQGILPKAATGTIISAITVQSYQQVGAMPSSWQIDTTTPASTIGFITNCYSEVVLQNTGSYDEQFQVFSTYNYPGSAFGVTADLPLVAWAVTNLAANQTAHVFLYYSDDNKGAPPTTSSTVPISVVATSASGTYFVGSVDTTVEPKLGGTGLLGFSLSKNIQTSAAIAMNASTLSNNVVVMENPIKCVIFENQSNQTYQAQISVVNHFAIPLIATVTQSLPSGITVLSTDGVLGNSSIVWQNTIPINGLVGETFTFSLSTMPGAQTNLPAPTLVFSDATATNTLSVQSFAPTFNGLFPVRVSASIPAGTFGVNTTMKIAVTNLTSTVQAGSVVISIANSGGTQITNLSKAFSVAGKRGSVLKFTLPGSLLPGQYSLTGNLSINGGGGQVFAGVYNVGQSHVRPTLTITSPKSKQKATNTLFTVKGTAKGKQGITATWYQINSNGWALASGTTNWSAGVTVVPGTNTVQAYTVDRNGNVSLTNSVRFMGVLPSPLLAQANESGASADSQAFQLITPATQAGKMSSATVANVFGIVDWAYSTNGFSFTLQNPTGLDGRIQASTNLSGWETLTNFIATDATVFLNDPAATNATQKFYRAVSP